LGSALLPREEAVELVGEALAVRVVERCGAAGALPRAAQLVQVVAQREALLDVLRGIELAARVERVAALGDHVGGERDVRGDDQVAGRELAHDVAVRDVDAARHLEGADVRRGRRAQELVRHQRHGDLAALRGAVEDVLDGRGAGVGVDPDVHELEDALCRQAPGVKAVELALHVPQREHRERPTSTKRLQPNSASSATTMTL